MKIVIIASHSGGHIAPALAFSQELLKENNDTEIVFITTEGSIERKLLSQSKFEVVYFPKKRLTIAALGFLYRLFTYAMKLYARMKPDCVMGFGGYISIPFIIAAFLRKIPRLIHEQNVTMGLANKLLASWSNKVVLSFPNATLEKSFAGKASVVGIPLRSQLERVDKEQARAFFGLDRRAFTILVMGGSQGAQKINTAVLGMLETLQAEGVQLIHIAGSYDFERVKKEYEGKSIRHVVYPFFDAMEYAWSACDCAITRAGANTIAEIIHFCVPALIIPYPYARLHQAENAQFLSRDNAAVVIDNTRATAETLWNVIAGFKNYPERLDGIRQALQAKRKGNARKQLVFMVCSLMTDNQKRQV